MIQDNSPTAKGRFLLPCPPPAVHCENTAAPSIHQQSLSAQFAIRTHKSAFRFRVWSVEAQGLQFAAERNEIP
jgi:hypothetical protein